MYNDKHLHLICLDLDTEVSIPVIVKIATNFLISNGMLYFIILSHSLYIFRLFLCRMPYSQNVSFLRKKIYLTFFNSCSCILLNVRLNLLFVFFMQNAFQENGHSAELVKQSYKSYRLFKKYS